VGVGVGGGGGGGGINCICKCGNTFLLVDSESHILSMKLGLLSQEPFLFS